MKRVWDKVGEKELRKLYYDEGMSDNQIASLYGVPATKVRYKRNKYGLSIKNLIHEEFVKRDESLFATINTASKQRVLQR